MLWAADHVTLIDQRSPGSPFEGDVHPDGNPHLHLDPRRWLGIEQVADLEPKPGMPPTSGHLQRVLELTRSQPPRAIVVSAYHDPRPAQWLAQPLGRSHAGVQLPSAVSEEPSATLPGLFDDLITRLLEARWVHEYPCGSSAGTWSTRRNLPDGHPTH
jgi:hypothetical protein